MYFDIAEFPTTTGGGRYLVKLRGNGLNLRVRSTIDVEMIDSAGKQIYCEVLNYRDRFNNYYISFEITDRTSDGLAAFYLVGEANYDMNGRPVPPQFKDEYNVRWSKAVYIMPFERNTADLIFDEPPQVSVAQIIVPATVQIQQTSSAYTYTSVTTSIDELTIVTSNFNGYDREFASSTGILDNRERVIRTNPTTTPTTINSVRTEIRVQDSDIQNGVLKNETTRFNTRLISSRSIFTKDYLGGYFEFFSSESSPKNVEPLLPTNVTVSGSVAHQFDDFNCIITEIINDKTAVLNKPLEVITLDNTSVSQNKLSTFTFKKASNFTGSITYVPNDLVYVTSSTVSQSYVEFTFSDLNPIGGQVYRMKTSAKLTSITGEYKVINDTIVTPIEYLTDAAYRNGTSYARHESEYRMIGHFVTSSILTSYWDYYTEAKHIFSSSTGSWNNNTLINSAQIFASYTQSQCLTTKYYQNYNTDQRYTAEFYLILDPYTELEVYMGSDPLNTYLVIPAAYPKAFIKTTNKDRGTRPGQYSPFGKYVGRVKNDRPYRKYYGKVSIDFDTDGNGFGAPVFRARVIDEMANTTGSAYIAEIGVKPYMINGFTPSIVQYAIPLPQEFVEAAAVSQSIDFKIDYLDYTGKQSEFTTYLDSVVLNLKAEIPSNTCQADKLYFTYDNTYYGGATPAFPPNPPTD
jgi:hypothetical protein